jgi:hypothetical protein
MMHETPHEVLGFKKKFGKFFGTDNLVQEGWVSYQASLQAPQFDAWVGICFLSAAIATYRTMLEIGKAASDKERVIQKMEERGPDKLWQEYRKCITGKIDGESLDRYKKAFYGGCWFINMVWFTCHTDGEQQFVKTAKALRDEIDKIRINIGQLMDVLAEEREKRPG